MSELLIDLEKPIGYLASLLIFFGQLTYFKDVWQKKIAPSVLTWFGWALLMATLIVVQVLSTGWDWSLMSITSCTFGCVAIGIVSLVLWNLVRAIKRPVVDYFLCSDFGFYYWLSNNH